MPLFVLYTNLPKDKIPEDFLQKTSAFLAKQLEKPENVCCQLRFHDSIYPHVSAPILFRFADIWHILSNWNSSLVAF